MRRFAFITVFAFLAALPCTQTLAREPEDSPPGYDKILQLKKHTGLSAKNIILLISDGCGYQHVDVTSMYQYGQTRVQVYEHFPVKLGMSTFQGGQGYNPQNAWRYFNYAKTEYTDSAAAATAMSAGVKTYGSAIGVDLDKNPVVHAMEKAESLGKATGVVTSVPLSHATPAGFVAHNETRGNYEEIAKEMIYHSAVDVIFGCGHPKYNNDGQKGFTKDTDNDDIPDSYQFKYVGGEATWNDLLAGTAGGDADRDGNADPWTFIQKRAEFKALITAPAPPKRVLGVARAISTLQQGRSGDNKADPYVCPLNGNVPTLEEMTKAALNVLGRDPDGFVLMIEGGAVDWASHGGQTGRMIEEEIDFNKSVEAVVEWVRKNSNWIETVVFVTGDHETGYLTGPGSGPALNGPSFNPPVSNGMGVVPGVEWHSGSHTNHLIPFYGGGFFATVFYYIRPLKNDPIRGRYFDNTVIAEVMKTIM